MKKSVLIFLILLAVNVLKSQTAPLLVHETISNAEVIYQNNSSVTTGTVIMVVPSITLSLKADSNLVKINFRLYDNDTKTLLHQGIYEISQAPVNNNSGQLLFTYSNLMVKLSNGEPLLLKPYLFEFSTENSAGEISEPYSVIK